MAAHRYWRVQVTARAVEPDSNNYIQDIQFRESIGGADVTGSGTAISNSGVNADRAFDNVPGTAYVDFAGTTWVGYDFGAGNEKEIIEFAITATLWVGRSPKDFNLQYSDDSSTWVTTQSHTGHSSWFPGERKIFNAGGYVAPATLSGTQRWWRLAIESHNGDSFAVQVDKIELRQGGVNQVGSGTAYSGPGHFFSSAAAAFDSNATTLWSCPMANRADTWLAYDLGSAILIDEFALTIPATGAGGWGAGPDCAPKDFRWQRSDDGLAWQNSKILVGETGWADPETRTYAADVIDDGGGGSSVRRVVFVCQ